MPDEMGEGTPRRGLGGGEISEATARFAKDAARRINEHTRQSQRRL